MPDKIKISELPETTTLKNFYGVGVDFSGRTAKVPIELLKGNAGANGKSAYEIAVKNSFSGSEQQWLSSLKGDPGKDGAPGKSAYRAAVEGGFAGTEEEFNKSLSDIASGMAGSEQVVSHAEHRVGVYKDRDGSRHDIFENTYILTDLPAEGQTKEYEICDRPLGFGRYIRLVEARAASTDGQSFCFDGWTVEKVYMANQTTRMVVRCRKALEGSEHLIVRLRYIKYMGDRLSFSVTLPPTIDPAAVGLSVAPLKYDKRFAFTYTADDSVVGAYARIWRRIHRKWIDDVEFHHLGAPRTTGFVPQNALCMTDGCGNERRFGFSCAIWPSWGNQWSPEGFIADSSVSTSNPYITWEELRLLVDFGVSLCYHNVDERAYDKTAAQEIAKGFAEDNARAFSKAGRYMKVLGLPDGNATYLSAARSSELVSFIRSSATSNLIYLRECGPLWKAETRGGQGTADVAVKLDELAAQHAADAPYWVGLTSHRVSLDTMNMMETLHDLYGAGGDDSIWVASWDEIYEYVSMREGASVKKSIDGQTVTFEVYVPSGRAYYFREGSFLLSGIPSAEGVTVTPVSDNIKGESHGAHVSRWTGENVMLVNLSFNPEAEALAEKYTSRYEASAEASDREDAVYFVSMLLPALAEPLRERIDSVVPDRPTLRLSAVTINSGAASTSERNVTVTLEFSGAPTHYRLSESADLAAAEWMPYTEQSVQFTLSQGDGQKTVYAQIKDDAVESNIASGTISLQQTVTPTSLRAVLSLGWDWSAGGSMGATTYDSTLQIGKVRIASTPAEYDIFDTAGNVIGTASLGDLKETGAGNQGNTTGDNSGLYPDKALQFSAYKPTSVAQTTITLNLPAGRYRIKLLVNTKNAGLALGGKYTVEHEGTTRELTKPASFVDNFHSTMDAEVTVSQGPVYIKLSEASASDSLLLLNVIEIEAV